MKPRPGRPRSGRPKQITIAAEAAIIDRTLRTAPATGTHWSTRLMACATGHHHATIARIWRAHGLKPHRGDARWVGSSTYANTISTGTGTTAFVAW